VFTCFVQFLDQCTAVLDLPFSARRLFDKKGVEHFNLATLTRDELVYVTCGEPWSDPTLSKSEQQRHFLLSNIAADVAQMKQFVRLRDADSEQLMSIITMTWAIDHNKISLKINKATSTTCNVFLCFWELHPLYYLLIILKV